MTITCGQHDCMAIGEIELGLTESDPHREREFTTIRLPHYIRILSVAQSRARVPSLLGNNGEKGNPKDGPATTDPFVNTTVARLEDIAATFQEAEAVDALVGNHAPATTRQMRLGPLRREITGEWMTADLQQRSLKRSDRKKNKNHDLDSNIDSGDGTETGDDMDDEDRTSRPSRGYSRRNSSEGDLLGAGEDSQEVFVKQLFRETLSLVLDSLQAQKAREDEEDGATATLRVGADSLLTEIGKEVGDLGSTLAALMYHLPVLRHAHVASALCRASNVPQAPEIILSLGANCPSAVPCLVRGCLTALTLDAKSKPAVKKSLERLASLSPREANRIRTILQKDGALPEVQVALGLRHDARSVAMVILNNLAKDYDNLSCDREDEMIGTPDAGGQKARESFCDLVREDKLLMSDIFRVLLQNLGSGPVPRRLIFGRATLFLLHAVGAPRPEECDLGQFIKARTPTPELSSEDTLYSLALSTSVIVCARTLGREEATVAQTVLNKLLESPTSMKCVVFASQMCMYVASNDISGLNTLILRLVLRPFHDTYPLSESLRGELQKFCIWAVGKLDLTKYAEAGIDKKAVLMDSSALQQALTNKTGDAACLQLLLDEPAACKKLLAQDNVADLLVAAGAGSHTMDLPLVLPMQLEKLAFSVDVKEMARTTNWDDAQSQYIVLFVYCLAFLDAHYHSSFAIDPRDYATTMMNVVERGVTPGRDGIRLLVQRLLSKYSGELEKPRGTAEQRGAGGILKMLSQSIRSSKGRIDGDSSGMHVGRVYMEARQFSAISEVSTITISNLLSTPNRGMKIHSYSSLCRDPLVLLRCQFAVWQHKELRQILLTELRHLLKLNEVIVCETAGSEDTANEILCTRDCMVLRSLLVLVTESNLNDKQGGIKCSYTTEMIRSLVASRVGLASALLKTGISNNAIDFMVENVPESINDAPILSGLLSERSHLSAAEKLKIADGALRISIYCGMGHESEAKILANAAMAALIAAFFLVVGPVGVPVNVFVEDDSVDITQRCRSATQRMLEALQRVHRNRGPMRNDCANALQKLAGLCKGEAATSGVGGAVANRRKRVLKDVYDAIGVALNAMGSGVQI